MIVCIRGKYIYEAVRAAKCEEEEEKNSNSNTHTRF